MLLMTVTVHQTVLVYFSAHWCPPCRGFTPKLAEWYVSMKAKRDDFEVVFVSSDRDEGSFNEYYHEMPWLALVSVLWRRGLAVGVVCIEAVPFRTASSSSLLGLCVRVRVCACGLGGAHAVNVPCAFGVTEGAVRRAIGSGSQRGFASFWRVSSMTRVGVIV